MNPQLIHAPEAVKRIEPADIVELDVRPTLRDGGEPFSEIMAAIARTPPRGALRLHATFEPRPLFHVLGAQGWRHWVEQGDGEDWSIWFYREQVTDDHDSCAKKSVSELAALKREHPELRERLTAAGTEWRLDVRRLMPPEPMELTLVALEKLPKDSTLLQINERVPQFLLPHLESRNFAYKIQPAGNKVLLLIRRR